MAITEPGSDSFVSTGNVIVLGNFNATESGSDTMIYVGNVFSLRTITLFQQRVQPANEAAILCPSINTYRLQ